MTDPLADATQPRCPVDGILMRDIDGGWQCPYCGEQLTPVVKMPAPPRFTGPAIRGG